MDTHLEKPGKVREFKSGQGSQGNVSGV